MFGLNVKDINVKDIKIESSSAQWGLRVTFSCDLTYKNQRYTDVYCELSTTDASIFGISYGYDSNHVRKAKWLLKHVENNSWWLKRYLESMIKEKLRIYKYMEREQLLLDKYNKRGF